jgi:hypothetical protein
MPSATASPSSSPSGTSNSESAGTSVRCAIEPNGATQPLNQTRRPSAVPTPSRPATEGNGGLVTKTPAAVATSTGLTPATRTSTTTCPGPATGSSNEAKLGVPGSVSTAASMA